MLDSDRRPVSNRRPSLKMMSVSQIDAQFKIKFSNQCQICFIKWDEIYFQFDARSIAIGVYLIIHV